MQKDGGDSSGTVGARLLRPTARAFALGSISMVSTLLVAPCSESQHMRLWFIFRYTNRGTTKDGANETGREGRREHLRRRARGLGRPDTRSHSRPVASPPLVARLRGTARLGPRHARGCQAAVRRVETAIGGALWSLQNATGPHRCRFS